MKGVRLLTALILKRNGYTSRITVFHALYVFMTVAHSPEKFIENSGIISHLFKV